MALLQIYVAENGVVGSLHLYEFGLDRSLSLESCGWQFLSRTRFIVATSRHSPWFIASMLFIDRIVIQFRSTNYSNCSTPARRVYSSKNKPTLASKKLFVCVHLRIRPPNLQHFPKLQIASALLNYLRTQSPVTDKLISLITLDLPFQLKPDVLKW